MRHALTHFFKQHQINADNATFLVALSGGADSMTLLHLLHHVGVKVIALHCNFHLRGEESNEDEQFVWEYCQQNNIPIHITSFETNDYAQRHGLSIEMAARELRYNWFREKLKELQADYIVVGHHADDQVETILINLCRGTGIKGLTGMQPINGKIIRPLLHHTQEQVMNYIDTHNIPYRFDSSNDSDAYVRNKIRHQVLPVLKKINPSLQETIRSNSYVLEETFALAMQALASERERCVETDDNQIHIPIAKVMECVAPFSLLYDVLTPLGFSKGQIEDILESAGAESGRQFYSPTHMLIRERDQWHAYPILETPDERHINQPGTYYYSGFFLKFSYLPASELWGMDTNPSIAYIDTSLLNSTLILRTWQQGDFFYPIAQKTFRKKVSDFYKDKKFSEYQKRTNPILLSEDKIVWIVGQRLDDRFKLTAKTKRILKVEIITEEDVKHRHLHKIREQDM
ncbi:MAG: tRNA lysidine(34) synthetase TilS [Marinifilaceae bacterium]